MQVNQNVVVEVFLRLGIFRYFFSLKLLSWVNLTIPGMPCESHEPGQEQIIKLRQLQVVLNSFNAVLFSKNCFVCSFCIICNLSTSRSLCLLLSLQSLCVSGAAGNQRASCPGHCDRRDPSTATFSEITCTKTSYECPYSQTPLKSKSSCTYGLRNVILNIC